MSASKTISVTAQMGMDWAVRADIRGHRVVIDQPENAGGSNEGPTPLEYFLFSLAGCIASIARIAALQQKLELRSMAISVDGVLNPAGLLGKPTADRMGFQTISVRATIDTDLSAAEKARFLDLVCERCPLHDNIRLTTEVVHRLA